MLKKVALIGLLVLVVGGLGGYFWVRSAFTGDLVRNALAEQVSAAIGQPVSIGRIGASLSGRLTVTLGDVTIGKPASITAAELSVGTALRALLSRRIEHASLRLTGATIQLPLPEFKIGSSTPESSAPASAPPVEIVSIDEIVLSDVRVVSGGKTVRADIELVPQGSGVVVRRIALGAGEAKAEITGTIADLNGPKGDLQVKTGILNVDELLAFGKAFSAGAQPGAQAAPAPTGASAPAPPAALDVTLALDATRATLGGLSLEPLQGKARVTAEGLTLDPVAFGVFGGRYEGSLQLLLDGDLVRFRGGSKLSNIDVAAAAAFGGSPNTISGRLSGRLDINGRGADPSSVMTSARGSARVDIDNGVIKNLGLLRSVVVATSMRDGSTSALTSDSNDEPFTKLGATLAIADGALTTNDLVLDSKSLSLAAQGAVKLLASTVDLKGRVQLSDELSQQAGRDLVKYTQDGGRVTLAATVTGSIESPSVRIDAGDLAKRALRNAVNEQKDRATDEAKKTVSKKLGGLFGR